MSRVAITKCETTPQTLLERMEVITDSIRKRAFNLFQNRDGGKGSAVDDWLQAERDVVSFPASELVDEGKEFRASIALPGFEAKDIQVSAMPDTLVIEADANHSHEGKDGDVRFCEFSEKQIYRRLDLPESVDVDKVTASIDKGILHLTAPKATAKENAAAAA
jgi:HSP20 family molecular chaperone IbpA